jgi:putative transposase
MPGKSTGNVVAGAPNWKFWAESLNARWFLSLDDTRVKCRAWRSDYNEDGFCLSLKEFQRLRLLP